MAKISFQYRGIKDAGKLSIRLIHGEIECRVSSPIVSKKEYWLKRTTKNGKTIFKHRKLNELDFSPNAKNHRVLLESYSEQILNIFEKDFNNGEAITNDWLRSTIDIITPMLDKKEYINKHEQDNENIKQKERSQFEHIFNSNLLTNALEKMDIKYSSNKDELKKYKVSLNLLLKFQAAQNQIFKTKDLNQEFADSFMNWGLSDMEYSESYINQQLKQFRRAVVYVYENDEMDIIEVSKKLKSFKMFKNVYRNKIVIPLNYKELDIIDNTAMPNKDLEDAKKAILLGCETGLRYCDFNKLNDSTLKNIRGIDCWEFRNNKTKKLVRIPKTKRIIYLLNKYGIPKTDYPDNEVELNEDIKKVCEIAKITEIIKGSKSINVTIKGEVVRRSKIGMHPKNELITTRTFRRSFTTNYHGEIDTALVQSVTGHTTENMLRAYIDVTDDSNVKGTVEQMNNYHKKLARIKKKEQSDAKKAQQAQNPPLK